MYMCIATVIMIIYGMQLPVWIPILGIIAVSSMLSSSGMYILCMLCSLTLLCYVLCIATEGVLLVSLLR